MRVGVRGRVLYAWVILKKVAAEDRTEGRVAAGGMGWVAGKMPAPLNKNLPRKKIAAT